MTNPRKKPRAHIKNVHVHTGFCFINGLVQTGFYVFLFLITKDDNLRTSQTNLV
jgi:Zn-dependent protease with chaperone function